MPITSVALAGLSQKLVTLISTGPGGFHWALWVCGAIALLALPATATLLLRRPAPPAGRHGPAPAPGTEEAINNQVRQITR
jgi:hypothetical protein